MKNIIDRLETEHKELEKQVIQKMKDDHAAFMKRMRPQLIKAFAFSIFAIVYIAWIDPMLMEWVQK